LEAKPEAHESALGKGFGKSFDLVTEADFARPENITVLMIDVE
jgi:hypothetical protein